MQGSLQPEESKKSSWEIGRLLMPKNARILQLQDDDDSAKYVEQALRKEGHTVKTIGTLYEFGTYLQKEPAIDIALIDNHVPWNPGERPDYKAQGAIAEEWVRKYVGDDVIVIATTTDEQPGYGDYHVSRDMGDQELVKFIGNLRRKEY